MPDDIQEILAFDPAKPVESDTEELSAILQFDPAPQSKQPQVQDSGEDDMTWKEAVVEGMWNIPSSGWEFAKDTVTPILHPKETGKALWNMIQGAAQKVTPGEQDEEKYFDGLVDFYRERYGSTDGFKNAIAEDPVGVLSDVATIFIGAGTAVKSAGLLGKAKHIGSIGKTIEKIGMSLEPINIAAKISTAPLRLIPEKIPIKMYESAVKYTTNMTAKQREGVTRTAIAAKNQIMPTSKGIEKLRGMIDNYNVEINTLINQSANSGKQIPVPRLFRGLHGIKDQMKRLSDEPRKVEAAFKQVVKEWGEALEVGSVRSPHEVQKMKTRIYKDLKTLYEQHKTAPVKKELRKGIARNAKESLEEIIPEIKDLNRQEGELLELLDAIESKANRITNRDLIGIGLPVKMGTGSGIGYMFAGEKGAAIGTATGFILGIYDTPQVKAKMALVINRLREQGVVVKPTPTLVRLGLYQAAQPGDFITEDDE